MTSLIISNERKNKMDKVFKYKESNGDKKIEVHKNPAKKKFWRKYLDKNGDEIPKEINNESNKDREFETELYRLDEALSTNKHDFLILDESEKAIDHLYGLGLCGTSIIGGAGSTISNNQLASLPKDISIAILPHNDNVGYKFAHNNAKKLTQNGIKCKVVELDYYKENDDVEDWLKDDNNSLYRLLNIIEKTKFYKNTKKKSNSYSTSDLLEQFKITDYFVNLRFKDKGFYSYKNNYWQLIDKDEISSNVYHFLKEKNLSTNIRNKTDEIVNLLRYECQKIEFKDKEYLPLKDGLIKIKDLLDSIDENELIPHSPFNKNSYCLNYNLNPNIDNSFWLSTVNSILPDPRLAQLLKQIFGYILFGNNDEEKAFIFIGNGGNGKGVISTVLRELLGRENCSELNLNQLGSNSKSSYLLSGKRLNIINEIADASKADCSNLKAIISGEPLLVDRKYKDPVIISPNCSLLITTNIFPKFQDRSDGIWRRLIILPFNQSFVNNGKKDKRLKNSDFWKNEIGMEGIFNWALEGYRDLVDNEFEFLKVDESEELLSYYRENLNPVKRFADEYLSKDIGNEIPTLDVYESYKDFTSNNGYKTLASGNLTNELKKIFPFLAVTKNPLRQSNDRRCRNYININFKDNVSDTADTVEGVN